MGQYIKVNDGEIIPVINIALETDLRIKGKIVLKIVIGPEVKPYQELFDLFTEKEVFNITEYAYKMNIAEDETLLSTMELKSEYSGFGKNFKMSYNGDKQYPNKYYIEVERYSTAELQIRRNKELSEMNTEAIVGLYEL